MITNDIILDKFRSAVSQRFPGSKIEQVSGGFNDSPGRPLSRFLASVVTPEFEGMDEAERQSIIWGILLGDDFSDEERRRVEFVYTDTPAELAAH